MAQECRLFMIQHKDVYGCCTPSKKEKNVTEN